MKDRATFAKERLEVFGDVAAGHVDSADATWYCESLIYRNSVGNAIARVQDYA